MGDSGGVLSMFEMLRLVEMPRPTELIVSAVVPLSLGAVLRLATIFSRLATTGDMGS